MANKRRSARGRPLGRSVGRNADASLLPVRVFDRSGRQTLTVQSPASDRRVGRASYPHVRRLRTLVLRRAHIDATIAEAVAEAVAQGLSWSEIGAALGVTRQAARQRYGDAGDA